MVSDKQFGVAIAFLLPGFICLSGIALCSPEVRTWLATASTSGGLTVGGFLHSTLASLALGLLLSALRWAVVDQVHALMGVKRPTVDYTRLSNKDTYTAFQGVVENHYRYYQYYANSLVALVVITVVNGVTKHPARPPWIHWATAVTVVVLFLGSRDALIKCYERMGAILSSTLHTPKEVPNDKRVAQKEGREEDREEGSEESH